MRKSLIPVLVNIMFAPLLIGYSDSVITIEKMMTEEEIQTTGVKNLTASQRAALDRWLSEYTGRVIQFAQRSANSPTVGAVTGTPSYAGSGGGHWIRSKADSGSIIILEDGSMWGINSIDRITTVLWLPVTNVAVLKSESPVGEYKYLLVTTDDGEKALAKYLGKQ